MELKIFTNIKELEKLIAKYPQAAHDAQVSRVTEAASFMERVIKDNKDKDFPIGAGPTHLKDRIFHKVQAYGESVWGTVAAPPAEYGVPLELGTRPHPVSIKGQESLRLWVEKKLGLSGKEAKSATFLIARAISRRGSKGYKMFTKNVSKHEAAVIRILEQIPADIIKRVQGH